jgi:hypothetical protein
MNEEIKEGEDQKEGQAPEKPLDKMTAKELREIALDIPGVDGVHAMKKDELLAIIKKYRGIEDEGPPRKSKQGTARPAQSVKELKGKISQLKTEKEAARRAKDRIRVDLLRRRINRLKKQTRKVTQAT